MPSEPRQADRLTAVVVFPTPPFWLAMAMTLGTGRFKGTAFAISRQSTQMRHRQGRRWIHSGLAYLRLAGSPMAFVSGASARPSVCHAWPSAARRQAAGSGKTPRGSARRGARGRKTQRLAKQRQVEPEQERAVKEQGSRRPSFTSSSKISSHVRLWSRVFIGRMDGRRYIAYAARGH